MKKADIQKFNRCAKNKNSHPAKVSQHRDVA